LVFQNYALYPHMSVYNNMAYGLRNRRMPESEIDTRVNEAAKNPRTRRAAAAKAAATLRRPAPARRDGPRIVRQPKVFLFDEPLSNLDAKLRIALRVEIRKIAAAG